MIGETKDQLLSDTWFQTNTAARVASTVCRDRKVKIEKGETKIEKGQTGMVHSSKLTGVPVGALDQLMTTTHGHVMTYH